MTVKKEERSTSNLCTSNSGTFPTYRKIEENQRKRGRYISPGDSYFSAHLSYYKDHCIKDKKQRDSFDKNVNRCLENEIRARAENKIEKIQKELNDSRKISIDKQEIDKTKKQYTSIKVEKFKSQIIKYSESNKDISNLLNRSLRRKKVTSYRIEEEKESKKGTIALTPTAGFSKKMVEISDSAIMAEYLNSLINYCSIWIKPIDFRKLPIVYPHKVRRVGKDQKGENQETKKEEVKWDNRGFILESNPIGAQLQKKRIQGGFLRGEKITGSSGYIACHIWYETTLAPPFFTYIPNIVWLPRIIAFMSDEPMKRDTNIIPSLLKQYTRGIYQRIDRRKKALMTIVNTTWNELDKDDKDKSKKKVKSSSISRIKLSKVKTEDTMKNLLSKIEEFKDAKKPEVDVSIGPEGYLKSLYNKIQKSESSVGDLEIWLSEYSKAISKSSTKWVNHDSDYFTNPSELENFVRLLCNKGGLSTEESKQFLERSARLLDWIEKCGKADRDYHKIKDFEDCVVNEFNECKDPDKGNLKFYMRKFLPVYLQFKKDNPELTQYFP